ncbi:hypothetical protein BDQ17DRAFT_1257965, partial [Cyathus striatus]
HPSWEQILAADEIYQYSLKITIEEQMKLGIPENYQGKMLTSQAEYDAWQSNQMSTTQDLQRQSPHQICSNLNPCVPRYIPCLAYSSQSRDNTSTFYSPSEHKLMVPIVDSHSSTSTYTPLLLYRMIHLYNKLPVNTYLLH